MDKILELLQEAMSDYHVEITINSANGVLECNVNTGAKSDCILKMVDNKVVAFGRYNVIEIEDRSDLYNFIENCRCGRNYMHHAWDKLLSEKL